jgi:hypothetical protein
MLLAAPSLTDPSTLCLVVLVVATGFLLMRASRHLARQHRDVALSDLRTSAAPQSDGAAGKPDEASRWTVEMHETARILAAQLDSKMSALAALVTEADRAAAQLEVALAKTSASPRPSGTQAESLRADARATPRDQVTRTTEGSGSRVQGSDAQEGANENALAPRRAGRNEEVYTLADYGFDSAEIARRMGIPIGEVELILGLRAKDSHNGE